MTCLEKYKMEHGGVEPNLITMCPHESGGVAIKKPQYCQWDPSDGSCERCWNREVPGTEPTTEPVIKDSGERRQFDTGAVRDIQEGKGRCDLMPLDVVELVIGCGEDSHVICAIGEFQTDGHFIHLLEALEVFTEMYFHNSIPTMLLEVAKHFEEGAKKYGENNWQKGIPVRCYIDSAVRHYLKFQRGDKDEPHDRAFCWNILCAIWTCKHKPELNDYAPKQDDHTCINCGAPIPAQWQYCTTCWENVHGGG